MRASLIAVVVAVLTATGCQSKKKRDPAADPAASKTISTTTDLRLPTYPVTEITELDLAHADKRVILRRRADKEWMLIKPIKARADRRAVEAALQELGRMEGEAAPVSTRPQDWGRFKVTPEESVVIRARANDRVLPVLHLGRKKWVRVDDNPGVLVAYHINYFTFARSELRFWLDRTLAKLDPASVTGIDVTDAKGRVAKASHANGSWSTPAAKALANRLRFLMAHDRAEVSEAAAGLDEPRSRITIRQGAKKLELAVGSSAGGFTYVTSSRAPGVWKLQDSAAAALLINVPAWRKK